MAFGRLKEKKGPVFRAFWYVVLRRPWPRRFRHPFPARFTYFPMPRPSEDPRRYWRDDCGAYSSYMSPESPFRIRPVHAFGINPTAGWWLRLASVCMDAVGLREIPSFESTRKVIWQVAHLPEAAAPRGNA